VNAHIYCSRHYDMPTSLGIGFDDFLAHLTGDDIRAEADRVLAEHGWVRSGDWKHTVTGLWDAPIERRSTLNMDRQQHCTRCTIGSPRRVRRTPYAEARPRSCWEVPIDVHMQWAAWCAAQPDEED
jgi:hypothetical protein